MVPFLSIIIPNYNEQANLERGVLQGIESYLKTQQFSWEVIISDDGSTDNSLAILRAFVSPRRRFHLLLNRHAGKPYALRAGILAAQGQYILFTDMDQSTPISELNKLLPYAQDGARVVIGSRGTHRSNSSFFRKYVVSLGFSTIRRLILLPRIVDTQCGFKLIETKLARQLFSRMRIFHKTGKVRGWKVTAYDVEMLFLARKQRVPIKEIRVSWKDQDVSIGKSRNFIKESFEMLFEILRVRINDFLGKYD